MSRVIISRDLSDSFSNYKVVSSFEEAKNIDKIDYLIIHSYLEDDLQAGVALADLYERGVSKFGYVSSTPSASLKMSILGLHGFAVTDEFYFDDEAELDALIDSYEESDDNISAYDADLEVIGDFMKAYLRKEKRVETPVYLESVQGAIESLKKSNHELEAEKRDIAVNALDIFKQAREVIEGMDAQRQKLEKQLNKLQETMRNEPSTTRASFGGVGVQFFPSVSYTGRTKVLLIREYSPCRYLTSFVIAYHHHLQYDIKKKAKVVFVLQKGAGVLAKYRDFVTITQESLHNTDLYSRSVVATNTPKKDVMNRLLSNGDDVAVVVDRLYGAQDILTGRVRKVCAVSGLSDLNRYNIKAENTIFPVSRHPNGLIYLPRIENFPADPDSRKMRYQQTFSEDYRKLDKLLDISR